MGNSVGKILPSYPDRIWLEDVVAEGTFEHLLAPLPELSKEQLQRAAEKSRVPVDVPDPSLLERSATVWTESAKRRRQLTANYTALDWLSVFIPAIAWLRTYKWREWLVKDILAGLSVAVMVVPQGMSYAQNLAFLPQVFGLYGAFVPCIAYSFLGSSRHLAVGPVAVTSLLLGAGLSNMFGDFSINPSHPQDAYEAALQERYNHAAIQISFMAGFFYTLVGVLRLGWIINFLSAPVVSGFMTGAASIIISTQVKYVTGQYALPNSSTVIKSLQLVFDNTNLIRIPELAMGFSFIVMLLAFQILGTRYKVLAFMRYTGPIAVTIVSLLITNFVTSPFGESLYTVDYNNPDSPVIKDVGRLPPGLPRVTASWWLPLFYPSSQLGLAAVICILDIAESTTVARRLAREHKYKLNYTQELTALGVANVLGAVFNCYTTTGAFSRSSVSSMAGAQTLLASFTTGIAIMVILLCATPIFAHLSVNVQGAIVIVAVLSIFDFKNAFFYWRVDKLDFLCWLTAYVVVALAGPLEGFLAAVGLSVVIFLLKLAFPRIHPVGRIPGTDLYRDPRLYTNAELIDVAGVLAMRVEAPLFFANSPVVKDYIEEQVSLRRSEGQPIKAVVVDLDPVTQMDGGTAFLFRDFFDELGASGITLIFANPSQQVLQLFKRACLDVQIKPENMQLTMAEAVALAREVAGAPLADKQV